LFHIITISVVLTTNSDFQSFPYHGKINCYCFVLVLFYTYSRAAVTAQSPDANVPMVDVDQTTHSETRVSSSHYRRNDV